MYEGRTVQGVEKAMRGFDESQSPISLPVGMAQDMDNFEIDIAGTLQTRLGYTQQYDFTGGVGSKTLRYFGQYFTNEGIQVFVAVVDNSFFESVSPSGPWTDRTGGVTLSSVAGPWVGSDLNGKFILVNGTDQPIEHEYGINIRTLENASLILPPSGVTITVTGTPNTNRIYVVTALTARGETTISNLAGGPSATTLDSSNFNTIQWDLRAGAQGYNVYKLNTTGFSLMTSVGAFVNTWSDTGGPFLSGGPPAINTAYNTPLAWVQSPPQCIGVMARGRAQHFMASRDSQVWVSAISDALDWETVNNAFNFPVRGGRDNTIKVMATLYDYTVLFSDTNAFVYSGSTYNDFQMVKLLSVGCSSPHSILPTGDELWFWSDIGPNTLSRVMQGQDLQTYRPMSQPVVNTVNSLSNRAQWGKIVAWNDLRLLRVGWAYPNGTDSTVSKAILRGTTENIWARHSMPNIVNAVTDETRNIFIGTADAKIHRLYQGQSDNGALISATYKTGWYDSQSNLNRYMVHLDVIIDKTIGNYNLTAEIFWDFATTASSTHTLTQSLTDGIPVYISTPLENIHRLFVKGIGRYFMIKYTVTESPTQVRILGWREELYAKGRP